MPCPLLPLKVEDPGSMRGSFSSDIGHESQAWCPAFEPDCLPLALRYWITYHAQFHIRVRSSLTPPPPARPPPHRPMPNYD